MTILQDLKLQYRTGGIAQKLIFWNVGVFLISLLLNLVLENIGINIFDWVSLSSKPASLIWKPWSILSYAFFHATFWHLLFNMMILNFSSRLFLTLFSERQFVGLYFSGAVFAGIIYMICYFVFPSLRIFNTTMVGASAAIMAILIAISVQSPLMEVRLMFIGTVKLWHIAAVLLVLDLVQLPLENTGGHISHLGGALFGFLYVKRLQKGNDIADWFNKLIAFFVNIFQRKPSHNFKKVYTNQQKIASKNITSLKNKSQQQVDEILDKINKSGYDSLSVDEKEFLFKFGN